MCCAELVTRNLVLETVHLILVDTLELHSLDLGTLLPTAAMHSDKHWSKHLQILKSPKYLIMLSVGDRK